MQKIAKPEFLVNAKWSIDLDDRCVMKVVHADTFHLGSLWFGERVTKARLVAWFSHESYGPSGDQRRTAHLFAGSAQLASAAIDALNSGQLSGDIAAKLRGALEVALPLDLDRPRAHEEAAKQVSKLETALSFWRGEKERTG